jgi:hypothetical protein
MNIPFKYLAVISDGIGPYEKKIAEARGSAAAAPGVKPPKPGERKHNIIIYSVH